MLQQKWRKKTSFEGHSVLPIFGCLQILMSYIYIFGTDPKVFTLLLYYIETYSIYFHGKLSCWLFSCLVQLVRLLFCSLKIIDFNVCHRSLSWYSWIGHFRRVLLVLLTLYYTSFEQVMMMIAPSSEFLSLLTSHCDLLPPSYLFSCIWLYQWIPSSLSRNNP